MRQEGKTRLMTASDQRPDNTDALLLIGAGAKVNIQDLVHIHVFLFLIYYFIFLSVIIPQTGSTALMYVACKRDTYTH